MARRETAARRYAEAAFEIGRADGTLDDWERDLAAVTAALHSADLRRLVEHPAVAYGDKERVLRRVVGEGVSEQALNLVLLMIRRGRPGAIERMVTRFAELLRGERGIALAEVRSAMTLEAPQRAAVAAGLASLTGQKVEMNETVDDSLIGGISVRIGDTLYDGSVRNRLERLRARLTAA
jgi:F-type H+-transporting ATPase subunit delta